MALSALGRNRPRSQRPTGQQLQDFAQKYMNYSGPIDNSIYQGTLAGTKAGDTMWNTVNNFYKRHNAALENPEIVNLPLQSLQNWGSMTPQQRLEWAIKNKAGYQPAFQQTIGDDQNVETRGNDFNVNHIMYGKERPYAGGRWEGDTWVENPQTGPEQWKAQGLSRGSGTVAMTKGAGNAASTAGFLLGGMTPIGLLMSMATMANQAIAAKNPKYQPYARWLNTAGQLATGNLGGAAVSGTQAAAQQWGNKDMQRIAQGIGLLAGMRNFGSGNFLQNVGTGLSTLQRAYNLYNRIEQGK